MLGDRQMLYDRLYGAPSLERWAAERIIQRERERKTCEQDQRADSCAGSEPANLVVHGGGEEGRPA